MIPGANTITLSPAAMCEAIQEYLDSRSRSPLGVVKKVTQKNGLSSGDGFEIQLVEDSDAT